MPTVNFTGMRRWRIGCGARFLFLILVSAISIQDINGTTDENTYVKDETGNSIGKYAEDEVENSMVENNTTYTPRPPWHHISLTDLGSSETANYLTWISFTLSLKLSPYEYAMDAYQTTVYENGLKNFLIDVFEREESDDFEIKDVTVINNEMAMIKDQEMFKEEEHVLNVKSVVYAKPKEESPPLSSEDFGERLVSYCEDYSDLLIDFWKNEENDTIDRSDDHFEDSIAFYHVLDLEVEQSLIHASSYESMATEEKKKRIRFIAIAVASLIFFLSVFFIFSYFKMRKYSTVTGQHFDCVQGTDDDTNGSLSTVHFNTDGKKRPSSPRKNNYEISQNGGRVKRHKKKRNLLRLANRSKKYAYKEVKKSDNADMISSIDKDGQSISTSCESVSTCSEMMDDDDSLASIQSSILRGRTVLTNECFAPAGKLGVSIDTVDGQPVVHRVRENSPLFGVLERLDIITSVDEINTSSMTAAEVTLIMAKRMNKDRRITFLRGINEL